MAVQTTPDIRSTNLLKTTAIQARMFGISRETLYQYLRTDDGPCRVAQYFRRQNGRGCWLCPKAKLT